MAGRPAAAPAALSAGVPVGPPAAPTAGDEGEGERGNEADRKGFEASHAPELSDAAARHQARPAAASVWPEPVVGQSATMPAPPPTPFDELGGEPAVRALVERFYDAMERTEPTLTKLHRCDDAGKVSRESRDRFALFLIGWLGGPQDYIATHGHPRLRMRHGRVPVDSPMRDAWLRSMAIALDEGKVTGHLRGYLDQRFAEAADFLRNKEDAG